MEKHVKIYRDHFFVGDQDIVLCEVCSRVAVDIHHITPKGMGGSQNRDTIENLISLCRKCHNAAHGIEGNLAKQDLIDAHQRKMLAFRGNNAKLLPYA